MKRPEKWENLPGTIIKSILWNLELTYDAYEDSKANCIHSLLCKVYDSGITYDKNYDLIQGYYSRLSDEEFSIIVINNLNSLENEVKALKQLLDN